MIVVDRANREIVSLFASFKMFRNFSEELPVKRK